jgi:hypothetical protein
MFTSQRRKDVKTFLRRCFLGGNFFYHEGTKKQEVLLQVVTQNNLHHS